MQTDRTALKPHTPAPAWRLGGALLAVAMLWAGAAHGDPVSVSSSQRDGYGRVIFAWPTPVGHRAEIQGAQLNVQFARPIEAELGALTRVLGRYIESATIGADGSSVSLGLNAAYGLRNYDAGSHIIIDILDPASSSAATTTAQPLQGAAPGATTTGSLSAVGVRTGLHKGFTRVVFDWPEQVAYSTKRENGTLRLSFQRPASVDVTQLATGRVAFIKSAQSTPRSTGLEVSLGIDPTSRVRDFQIERRVVVDVYAPEAGTTPTATAKPPVREDTAGGPAGVVVAANTAPQQPEAAQPSDAPSANDTADQAADAPVELEPQKEIISISPLSDQQGEADNEQIKDAKIKVIKSGDGSIDIQFDWDEPVAAAIFNRADHLWIVFDRKVRVNGEVLASEAAPVVLEARHIESSRGTALRMKIAEGLSPEVKRQGLSWIFQFVRQPLLPSAPLQSAAQPNSPLGARLFISVPGPGEVIVIKDPEVGDNLAVVPVIPLDHGFGRTWSYPQVRLLPTKQGVVVQPLGDDIRVRNLRQGVEITSASSLKISSVSAEQLANVRLESVLRPGEERFVFKPLTRLLDMEKWNREDLKDFTDTRQALERRLSKSRKKKDVEKGRFELVRFYFSKAFMAEALGVMQIMTETNPDIAENPEILLMRGAANVMMDRYEDADTFLSNELLADNDESAFWRAALVARAGDLPAAAFELRRTGAITRPYTNALKMPMATLVANAAVEIGDIKQAGSYLEILELEGPNPGQLDQITFVSGKLSRLNGDFDTAIAKWEEVMEGIHRPSRAKAAVARAQLLFELERYSPQDMIDEYEKLRFSWRGDNFEFNLLRDLGAMYMEEGMFRNGLQTLKQAATNFRDHEDAPEVTRQMAEDFQRLYIDGAADALPPVTAIALYDEFRELTPAGEKGDEMIRLLADRLVSVDLLERATDLLQGQVEFRLQGAEKARVGARLSLVYLFDHKYDDAIGALNASAGPGLPEALISDRKMLRARALIGLDRTGDALTILEGDGSIAANELRGQIYWNARDWKKAAKTLGKLVKGYGAKARKPLDDKQAYAVLNWAVAQTLDQNERAIVRLRENYGEAMAQGTYGDAFALIADSPQVGLVNIGELTANLKEVESFRDFMVLHRERLTVSRLSELY